MPGLEELEILNGASFASRFVVLSLRSAPSLVFGFALAGVVPHLLTPARAQALMRGNVWTQALRGVVYGLPLPLCSCGVLPVYESLMRRGVPVAAAVAFLVATPELGLDALALSLPLLGAELTVARVVAAFFVALVVSLLTARFAPSLPLLQGRASVSSCDSSCAPATSQSLGRRVQAGLRFGMVEVFDHTMPWVVLGLLIAAGVGPVLSMAQVANVPPVAQVPIAVLVGIPMYVCAAGATPLAAVAIAGGLSPGAAVAYLIAGPATNLTTFGVFGQLHGRRAALRFGLLVICLASGCGWVIDAMALKSGAPPPLGIRHLDSTLWAQAVCLLVLAGLTLTSTIRQGPRGVLRQITRPSHSHSHSHSH